MDWKLIIFSLTAGAMVPLLLAGDDRNAYKDRGVLFLFLSVPVVYPLFTVQIEYLVFATVLTWLLAWIAFIDIQELYISDYHTLLVALWGLFSHTFLFGTWKISLVGMALATVLMLALKLLGWLLFHRKYSELDNGIGNGDVLLIIALGASFGADVVKVFFLANAAALIYSLPLIVLKRRRVDDPLPFVPFIYVGAVMLLLLTM